MCSRAVHRGRRLSAGLSCPGRDGSSPSTPVAAAAGSSRRVPAKSFARTSIWRASVTRTERLMRESGTLTATRAPASRQMRVTARSMGAACARSTPVLTSTYTTLLISRPAVPEELGCLGSGEDAGWLWAGLATAQAQQELRPVEP